MSAEVYQKLLAYFVPNCHMISKGFLGNSVFDFQLYDKISCMYVYVLLPTVHQSAFSVASMLDVSDIHKH